MEGANNETSATAEASRNTPSLIRYIDFSDLLIIVGVTNLLFILLTMR